MEINNQTQDSLDQKGPEEQGGQKMVSNNVKFLHLANHRWPSRELVRSAPDDRGLTCPL